MLKGTSAFRSGIRANGITFQKFGFNPNESGVDLIEMEGPDGNEISCTVHLTSVGTSEQGNAIATRLSTGALNRLAVFHSVAIGPTQVTEVQPSPLATPGVLSAECGEFVITGEAVRCCLGIPAARLRAELASQASLLIDKMRNRRS